MASGGADRSAEVAARNGHAPDRRAAAAPGGRAAGNSRVAVSDPETLVREIERTRVELARTVDAIADRVSPSNAARRAVTQIRYQAARVDPPVAAAAVALVLGTTAFFVWRRRRR
jgi:hypothetical protein